MISTGEMNKMRVFAVFLVFSAAVCRAFSKTKACKDGEVEFNCQDKKCYMTNVARKQGTPPQRMTINYSENEGHQEPVQHYELEFEFDDECPKPLHLTAYKTGSTTIACNLKVNDEYQFFCKKSINGCSPSSRFHRRPTPSGFNVTINQVTPNDDGVFWCGSIKSTPRLRNGKLSATLQKIKLSVKDVTFFKRSSPVGEDFSFYCNYERMSNVASHPKFICRGEDPNTCQTVASSSRPESQRYSIQDETGIRHMTVTIRKLEANDSGSYWCGVKNVKDGLGNVFINKLSLTVVRIQSSTSAFPSIVTTATSVATQSSSPVLITMVVCVVVLLVMLSLFVVALILIYKRFSQAKNVSAEKAKENYIYEEITERPLMPDSGSAINTVYATAALPTMHSDSLHYASVIIQRRSDGAAGDSLINKQESCQYSTVKY